MANDKGTTLSPYNLWNWWNFASLEARKDLMSQLLRDNWIKSLPPKEQKWLFEFAPPEVKSYLPKWGVIHLETLRLLGTIPELKLNKPTLSDFLRRRKHG